MFMDVVELRDFYTGPMGAVVRRILRLKLTKMCPDLEGQAIVGIGYATPFLGSYRKQAERLLAFMPAAQGVVRWPRDGRSSAALVDEIDLPLTENAVDCVFLVHAIEATHDPAQLLAEAWRVLRPGGRIILIASNRRGFWARADISPFGHGRPFSKGQLSRLLSDADFSPKQWAEALYVPPFRRRFLLKLAAMFERIGTALHLPVGGVIIVDAVKVAHGGKAIRVKPLVRRVPALAGRAAVSPARASD